MPMRTTTEPPITRRRWRRDLSRPLWALTVGFFVCALIAGPWGSPFASRYGVRELLMALAGATYGTLGLLLTLRPALVVRHATAMSRVWRRRLALGMATAWAGYCYGGSWAAALILGLSWSDAQRLTFAGLVVAAAPLVALALANWRRTRRRAD